MGKHITLRTYPGNPQRHPRVWVAPGPCERLRSYRRITPASVRRIERLALSPHINASKEHAMRGGFDLVLSWLYVRCANCEEFARQSDCYLISTAPDWVCPSCACEHYIDD